MVASRTIPLSLYGNFGFMPRVTDVQKDVKAELRTALDNFLKTQPPGTTRLIAEALNDAYGGKRLRAGSPERKPYIPKDITQFASRGGPSQEAVLVLDAKWPEWRTFKKKAETGRTSSTLRKKKPPVKFRDLPVIADITDPQMKEDLENLKRHGWTGSRLRGPDFFDEDLPVQPIRTTDYVPVFMPGSVLGLLPNAELRVGRIFAVTETESGKAHYAALIQDGGDLFWQFFNGTTAPVKECNMDAAVVLHLPDYAPGSDDAFYAGLGLKVGLHLQWPKENQKIFTS